MLLFLFRPVLSLFSNFTILIWNVFIKLNRILKLPFICRHPTSCASMAEIMSVLFFNTMRYNLKFPRDPSSDRFILSKGHAAPILYAGEFYFVICWLQYKIVHRHSIKGIKNALYFFSYKVILVTMFILYN